MRIKSERDCIGNRQKGQRDVTRCIQFNHKAENVPRCIASASKCNRLDREMPNPAQSQRSTKARLTRGISDAIKMLHITVIIFLIALMFYYDKTIINVSQTLLSISARRSVRAHHCNII